MISRILIEEPIVKYSSAAVFLCGRGVSLGEMYEFAQKVTPKQVLFQVIEPQDLQWYPAPNGANDQKKALEGMKSSLLELKNRISILDKIYSIPLEKTSIIGYSAGGVMALKLIESSEKPYHSIISLAGAILEPQTFQKAKTETPITIMHNIDDLCFEWEERYLPTKKTLRKNKYNLNTVEGEFGGHGITKQFLNELMIILSTL